MPTKNGIYRNIPDSVYHAETSRFSKHALDEFCANPWKWAKLRAQGAHAVSTSDTLALGRAVHAAVLEPERFEEAYVVQPSDIKVRRGKTWEAFLAENAGKEIITAETRELCEAIRESIRSNADAQKALNLCPAREVTALWECNNVPMKSRFDAMSDSGNILLDLKTCADASASAFMRDAEKFGYDIQAAVYMAALVACGYSPKIFTFVVAEKTYPFAVGVYIFSAESDFIKAGLEAFRDMLADVKSILDKGDDYVPPGYETQIDLPPVAWSKRAKSLREREKNAASFPAGIL